MLVLTISARCMMRLSRSRWSCREAMALGREFGSSMTVTPSGALTTMRSVLVPTGSMTRQRLPACSGRGALGQHRLAGPDRGRRGAVQVEVVAGHAGRVQVHQRQRGRRLGRGGHRDPRTVAFQVGPQQLPEPVAGEPAEVGHRLPEPGHRAGDVEPGAAQPGIDVTGRVDDQVDQRLVRHSNHAVHSTVPGRVIARRRSGRADNAGTRPGPGWPARPPGASGRRNPRGRPRPPR